MNDARTDAAQELAYAVGKDRADQLLDAYAAQVLRGAGRKLRDEKGSYGHGSYDYETGPGMAHAADRLDEQALEADPNTTPDAPKDAHR